MNSLRLLSRVSQSDNLTGKPLSWRHSVASWVKDRRPEFVAGPGRGVYLVIASRRTFDIGISLIGLVVMAPVFLLIGVLIAVESRGPIVHRSRRLGRGGRLFRCLKFRTMHVDAGKRLEDFLASDPIARGEYERFHKLIKDPRVTRIGRALRASSLDELPQLINVLAGDMSIVGPRPYLTAELENHPAAEKILEVKPGITGLWQVSGRSERTFRQRIRLESFYATRQSLGWDTRLLLRTLPVVMRRKGAH